MDSAVGEFVAGTGSVNCLLHEARLLSWRPQITSIETHTSNDALRKPEDGRLPRCCLEIHRAVRLELVSSEWMFRFYCLWNWTVHSTSGATVFLRGIRPSETRVEMAPLLAVEHLETEDDDR